MQYQILAKAASEDDKEKYGTDRIFYAKGHVEDGKDRHGEVMDFDKAWEQTNIWFNNRAPINDMHTNLVIGAGLEISKGLEDNKPTIFMKNMINSGNEYFDEIWKAINGKSEVLKRTGMSMGGLKKNFHQECDTLTCWKHWDDYFIMEYSTVDKPANQGAVYIGTLQKKATGEISINYFSGFKTLEEMNLAGTKKKTDLKKSAGKDTNCENCPSEEEIAKAKEILAKAEAQKDPKSTGSDPDNDGDNDSTQGEDAGADSDTSNGDTNPQGEEVISGDEFAKGILEQVNTQVNDVLTAFQKNMSDQVSKSITEGFEQLMKNFAPAKEQTPKEQETKTQPLVRVDFSKLTKISSTVKPPVSGTLNDLKKNEELIQKLPTWQSKMKGPTATA